MIFSIATGIRLQHYLARQKDGLIVLVRRWILRIRLLLEVIRLVYMSKLFRFVALYTSCISEQSCHSYTCRYCILILNASRLSYLFK